MDVCQRLHLPKNGRVTSGRFPIAELVSTPSGAGDDLGDGARAAVIKTKAVHRTVSPIDALTDGVWIGPTILLSRFDD